MAALQKIRSKGVLLILVIGVALFAFIAEEFFRSIETTSNVSKQQVGKVYGESISSQEFQQMLSEYQDALKFMRGVSSLTEEETNQSKDYVWQSYVNYKLIAHECAKLGLTVTDGELQQTLNEGTNPMLAQTPFRDEKTGRFSATQLRTFLEEYQKVLNGTTQVPQQYQEYYAGLYNYWKFIEKSLRENLLQQKFQILLMRSILSNPVEAKMVFDGNNDESDIVLASFPLSAVADADIKVTDADLQAKYNETKELYRQFVESRDIKYVSVAVEASDKDKEELHKEMVGYAEQLAQLDEPANLVRKSNSVIPYYTLAVTKNAYPADIQQQLDSVAVGSVKGPFYNEADNTENVIKLYAKVQSPDSVKIRQIQVAGATAEEAHERADSIYKALQGGAKFEELAKAYNQDGAEQWVVSAQYETSQVDEDNALYLNKVNSLAAGAVENISFAQGNIILQVLERKAIVPKYSVAVIKRPIEFSKETYSKAYNNFSHFVATSKTLEEVEKNAPQNGYTVEMRPDLYNSEHTVAGVSNTSDAMRWIFDAKEGQLSPLYECGNNDHLLLVALTKIHKQGYRPFDDVKDQVRAAVERDKKADVLADKLKGVKTLAEAQAVAGAVVDSLSNIEFGGQTFVRATGVSEPVINGSVWNRKAGDFVGPLKGQGGVYAYEITNQSKTDATYDEAEYTRLAAQQHLRSASTFGNDLYLDGKVVDKRYIFF